MPTLASYRSSEFVKLLLLGDSKTGKTGSLTSLVAAGYKLRIIDLDNLLHPLVGFVQRECPQNISNVEYRSLRDEVVSSPVGPMIRGPKAFMNAIKMLDKWKYKDGEAEIDLGEPCAWGPDTILVIDSLSRFCDAAYDFRDPLTPTGKTGEKDSRATYGDAQDAVEKVLAQLTSDTFRTNIIVIAHLIYMDMQGPSNEQIKKAYPQGVGQKLSPKIPQYFPTVVHYFNQGGKRRIRTTSTPLLDLANPKPFEIDKEYPIETGLADIFATLRGTQPQAEPKLRKIK